MINKVISVKTKIIKKTAYDRLKDLKKGNKATIPSPLWPQYFNLC